MYLPDKWQSGTIKDVCTSIVSGREKPKSFNGTIPWITPSDIQGKYLPSKLQKNYVTEAEANRIGAKIVPPNSVVMTVIGEPGLTAITTEPVILNQQLQAFVCTEHIDNKYLAYWLETQRNYMLRTVSKTTVPYMNKFNCDNIPILYPELAEQKRTTEILSAWDQALEITEKLICNSKKQKRALMQNLLTSNKRLHHCTEKWREEPLGNWLVEYKERSVIQDQAEVLTSSCQGLIPQSKYFGENRLTARNNIGFNIIPNNYITYRSRSDDGLFRFNINNTGRTGMVSPHYPVFHFPKGVNKFFADLFMLKTSTFAAYSVGTSCKVLPINTIKNIVMKIPCAEEQRRIALILDASDNEIKKLQEKIDCLRQIRKALVQQLLSGKIRANLV